jgi:drug/metabolite transporter (DMT)-like permease
MLPAFLTTFLFSSSILFASRSARELGGMRANVSRLLVALLILGIWSHGWGGGLGGAGLAWFFLSGAVGFGIGDMSMFASLPRIGPRLAILITQCLGAPIAGVAEYFILGTVPTPLELGCAGLILMGVALALAPDQQLQVEPGRFRVGLLFGLGSAMGQAFGAVLSRKANAVAQVTGEMLDGGTAAYQRIIAGVVFTLLGWWLLSIRGGAPAEASQKPEWRRAFPLVLGNALSGPILGVACFQWALSSTPSAVVLPIVSTSPLVTMGMAWFFQGTRPSARAIFGGVVAVIGACGMAWIKTSLTRS